MPRPVAPGRRYVGGLDGIRAVAVICVIAYHLNVPGAAGGMLGVGVFFTLSGYLITDILLTAVGAARDASGSGSSGCGGLGGCCRRCSWCWRR